MGVARKRGASAQQSTYDMVIANGAGVAQMCDAPEYRL